MHIFIKFWCVYCLTLFTTMGTCIFLNRSHLIITYRDMSAWDINVSLPQTQCQCQSVYTLDVHCSVHCAYNILDPVYTLDFSMYRYTSVVYTIYILDISVYSQCTIHWTTSIHWVYTELYPLERTKTIGWSCHWSESFQLRWADEFLSFLLLNENEVC